MTGFPGTARQLLHIGAGDGAEVAAWRAAGVTRMLLVEADPDTARALAARVGTEDIEVITGAVSGDPEPRPFRRCNLPGLSSFRAPQGLDALFPGLRVLAAKETRPLDPVALAARLDDGPAALVIEAPGEALGILQALQAGGVLDRFVAIRLQEGRETLYAGAPPAGAIRDWLAGQGFVAEFEPEPDDPDRPQLFARRDPVAGVQADLADAIARGQALEAERDAALAAMEVLRAELGETRAQVAATADLQAERDAARAETGTLRHQLDQAWQRVDERQADLTLAQQNLSVALRIQALRETDLAELQTRYGALLARSAEQDALLDRLAACLDDAVTGAATRPGTDRKAPPRRKARDG